MASKDFKVKNGLVVGGSGLFDSDVDILGQLKINGTVVINSGGILVTQYSGFDSDFAARLASSNTDSIQEGLTNLYYTTARVDSDIVNLVDSAYVQARAGAGVDSAAITLLIDSAYVQARAGAGVDSAAITLLIDSDYIQARQIIGGTTYYINDTRYLDYKFIADSGQTSFSGNDANGNLLAFDSNKFLIFINGIKIPPVDYTANSTTNVIDLTFPSDSSDEIVISTLVSGSAIIDSVGNIQIIGGAGGGLDSAAVINLIDSDYIQARQIIGGAGGGSATVSSIYYYTASNNQTTFTGADNNGSTLSYVAGGGGLQTYLNGVLLINDIDYTAIDGTSVVLDSGADSGDNLTFISNIVGAVYSVNDTAYLDYKFIANSGQSSFSGNDTNGNLLTFDSDKFSIFVNGIRIQPVDYSANSTTNVIDLASPADSGDEIVISTLILGGNSPYIIIDSDYIQARQTDPVSKAIAISMVFGN